MRTTKPLPEMLDKLPDKSFSGQEWALVCKAAKDLPPYMCGEVYYPECPENVQLQVFLKLLGVA